MKNLYKNRGHSIGRFRCVSVSTVDKCLSGKYGEIWEHSPGRLKAFCSNGGKGEKIFSFNSNDLEKWILKLKILANPDEQEHWANNPNDRLTPWKCKSCKLNEFTCICRRVDKFFDQTKHMRVGDIIFPKIFEKALIRHNKIWFRIGENGLSHEEMHEYLQWKKFFRIESMTLAKLKDMYNSRVHSEEILMFFKKNNKLNYLS